MDFGEVASNVDKAKAAAEMGRKLRDLGVSQEEAATAAHHELQHGLWR